MRRSLVVGNWKMNGSAAFVEQLLSGLVAGLGEQRVEVAVRRDDEVHHPREDHPVYVCQLPIVGRHMRFPE